jgi:DegV family protein with EDD domain
MSKVAIVTDSTADLPPELVRRRGVTVVPLTVMIGGQSWLDGVEIQPDEFYRRLATAASVPTTSQPTPARFAETYTRLLEQHDAVVSIHISARLSGTFASAEQAAAELGAADRIHLVDSALVSMPLGLLVLAAAKMAEDGAAAATIVEGVEKIRSGAHVYFGVKTLDNLARGGRIGRANALVGSILQVKPVLTIQDGEVTPLERVRTWDRALNRIVDLARAVDTGQGLCAIVGHAVDEDSAQRIAAALEPVADTLLLQPLGAVVGAHAGPGTVGVGCYPAELFPLGLKLEAAARLSR